MINIMDEYIKFMENCLLNYFKLTYGKQFYKKIALRYINTYLNVRYSNYIDEATKKFVIAKKISKALDATRIEISSKIDSEYLKIVDSYRNFAGYFFTIDQLYLLESQKKAVYDINYDRNVFFGIDDKSFVSEFGNMLRQDIIKKKEFFEAFDSNTFKIEYKKFTKNDYIVKLKDEVNIPEGYSPSIVKRVIESGNIGEDLTCIEYMQTTSVIIADLISCDFDKKYYVYLPVSFFDKKSSMDKLFGIIDNTYIQDKIRIIITFSNFVKYKTFFVGLIRNGFVFALYLDQAFEFSSNNIRYLELFDKIFIDCDKYYYKDMKNNLKIKDKIIDISEIE